MTQVQDMLGLIKRQQQQMAGAILVNYVLAMRAGGELRITQREIANAAGGKCQVSHAANGEWVLTAVPDPTEPDISQEDMDRYTAMVAREEVKQGNGQAPTAALEGDDGN